MVWHSHTVLIIWNPSVCCNLFCYKLHLQAAWTMRSVQCVVLCFNSQAVWNREITTPGQKADFFLALVMKEGDKGQRTFYQTFLWGELSATGGSKMETHWEKNQERWSPVGGERLEDAAVLTRCMHLQTLCYSCILCTSCHFTPTGYAHYSKHAHI